jgi:hypothetical protein
MQRDPPGEKGTPLVNAGAGGDAQMTEILLGDPDDPFAEAEGWR